MNAHAAEISYPHVDFHSDAPKIAGTTMKVVELVMAQHAHGWSPEELHFQYPHLSMGQIYGALTYYWDHRSVFDQEIAQSTARAERATKESTSPLQMRLRALKHAS